MCIRDRVSTQSTGHTRRQQQMSSNQPDKVKEVQAQVDEVKGIMVDNVDKMLNNMERADDLEQKTSDLNSASQTFKSRATTLKRRMWWQNFKLWLAIGGITLILLIIIIAVSLPKGD
eukprot:TRINITY_DN223_c0_g3_i1.p1 TRINITY_DN223_c0_g3~~TRINITY_DN223_c0_g3_i1.p1  ORF type:complete len:117 (-),score=46.26 TRINITY_DN223_c0_g3_i1:40-390(-)